MLLVSAVLAVIIPSKPRGRRQFRECRQTAGGFIGTVREVSAQPIQQFKLNSAYMPRET
jgi:hypothetical protein